MRETAGPRLAGPILRRYVASAQWLRVEPPSQRRHPRMIVAPQGQNTSSGGAPPAPPGLRPGGVGDAVFNGSWGGQNGGDRSRCGSGQVRGGGGGQAGAEPAIAPRAESVARSRQKAQALPAYIACAAQMAGGRGFEPRHTDSESAVLPLDEPPERLHSNMPSFGGQHRRRKSAVQRDRFWAEALSSPIVRAFPRMTSVCTNGGLTA